MILFLFVAVVVVGWLAVNQLREVNEKSEKKFMANKQVGMKCEKAIKQVVKALDADMLDQGKYPYYLDDEFFNRHKTIHRYVYNTEYWDPKTGSVMRIDTSFGDSYELFGYCRDNKIYTYVSDDKKIYADPYTASDIPDEYRQE